MPIRVTVTDTEHGQGSTVELAQGDYILIPTGGCVLANTERYPNGTVILTIKNHAPEGPARWIDVEPTS